MSGICLGEVGVIVVVSQVLCLSVCDYWLFVEFDSILVLIIVLESLELFVMVEIYNELG